MLMLGDDLDTFTQFLFSPEGAMFKWQFEQADGFDLDSPLLLKKIQSLVEAKIVSQATVDTIISGNVQVNRESALLKKFDMSSIAGDWPVWVAENIEPKGTPFSIAGVENTVITTGNLPLKEIK